MSQNNEVTVEIVCISFPIIGWLLFCCAETLIYTISCLIVTILKGLIPQICGLAE